MIFIGVTGGIGSGKSLVCSQFKNLNVPIFFADNVAKEITETDKYVQGKIAEGFGVIINGPQSELARKKLAEIVFSDRKKLGQLNDIIHPIVFSRLDSWKDANRSSSSSPYAIVEAALIFETGLDASLDYILTVAADEALRIARVMERDGSSRQHIISRMKNQMRPEEQAELSDFILHNNGSLLDLQNQVMFFHTLFSNLKMRQDVA